MVGAFFDLSGAEEMERLVMELFKEGKTDRQIAGHLTQLGHRSPQRKHVLRRTVQTIRHKHRLLRGARVKGTGGYVFKMVGDACCAAFSSTPRALESALLAQRAIFQEPWDEECRIRVRIALHTGVAEERDGDYFGSPANRVARLLSAGHGGQVLLSAATQELVAHQLPEGVELRDLGEHCLKDLFRPERIFQSAAPDLQQEFPSLRTLESRPNNLPIQPLC